MHDPKHRRKEERWAPCRLGSSDPENCPNCTPPQEERCSEWWDGKPCRVLGSHEFHRDGFGQTWWPEPEGRHRREMEIEYEVPCSY